MKDNTLPQCNTLAFPLVLVDDFLHSLSSGVSVTSSSWPMNQPNSDDKSVGGITDDAREREEHGKLLGKAKHGEILKSYYAGGSKALETGVSIATYYLGVTIRTYTTDFIYFCVLILES